MSTPDELAAQIIKDFECLAGDRGNFESQWTEVAQRIYPNQSKLFQSFGFSGTKGDKRTQELYDSTAAIALTRFAAILDSLLTPRNGIWHRIQPSDPYLMKDRQVRMWFDQVNQLLFRYRYSPNANFASQNQLNYKSLGAFGTGSMFIDKLSNGPIFEKGLRYRNNHLGEIYFKENHQGIIDEAYRHFPLTASQAYKQFGDDLPEDIRGIVNTSPDREFFFLHCVKPRADLDPQRKDFKGMPYASYYLSMTGKKTITEQGYNTFPYAISRYEQVAGETYGRSPAMDVLPAIKTLNEEKKTILKQGQRTVDPILIGPDDGVLDGFSMRPGAYNSGGVTSDGRPLVHTIPVGNIAVGKDLMDDERNVINDAFLITIFQILTENPQMTATEVMERTREKGILLAPTIGRQQSEYLGPMVDREIDLLSEQNLLPPMPQALIEAKGNYHTEYDSPLSRTQRAEEASGLMRTVETALQVVNVTQNPEPLDFFDWDIIIPDLADIQGVTSKWMRSDADVKAMRAQRGQNQQNQSLVNAAPGAAALIKAQAIAQKG